ncbi:MAG: polysaccharide lyase beta-sandwich domain-containing protein, partial [Gemmiger sp.]
AADTSQGAAGFNFWQSGEVNLPDGSAFTSIRAEGPASVTTSVRNGTLTVGVSDPTQKQSAVRLRLSGEGLSVIGADGRIEAVADTDGVTITVNTSGAAGASAVVTLSVPRKAIVGGVEVPITAEDGEVKIEVSGEEAKEIVSGADTSLTVDVSDVEDLQQITLPGELIDAVLESETVTELTVEGGNVSITLSGSVLETVALAAGQEGYSVSLLVNTASAQDSKLNDAQKEALEELTADALVVDVALLVKYDSGSVELHELGGPVTIRVCYKDSVGENETVYVRYLAEDGSAILLDSAYDAGSGIVTFVTDHFSCYALYTGARQGDAKPTPAPSQKPGQSAGSGTSAPATVPAPTTPAIPATGDNAPIALLIALAALSGLGLAVIGIRRKRSGK